MTATTLEGTVESCLTKRIQINSFVITELNVRLDTKEEDSSFCIKMQMRGNHRINRGERIKLEYVTHTGVNWILGYAIIDGKGEVIYSNTNCD